MQNIEKEYIIKDEFWLDNCLFSLIPWDRIFFYGDLGAGKSTFIRKLLRHEFQDPTMIVRSPTYTYYEKYSHPITGKNIYHFDLYRIEDYTTFVSIWGEEIFADPNSIMLVEWPELLEGFVEATRVVRIGIGENNERSICITA